MAEDPVDAIMEHYNCYDGFVILHGTDTMAYTAAALSYLIQNSKKPIILTGSQKPMGNPYTMQKLTFTRVFYMLLMQNHVMSVSFSMEKLFLGHAVENNVQEVFDAFESMNFPELAIIAITVLSDITPKLFLPRKI